MAMLNDTAVLARATQPLTAEVDAETVMFDPDKGSYYALGLIGTRVWDLLQEPIALSRMLATLLAEFDVDEPTCRHDVQAFLEQLTGAGLIEVVS